MIWLRGLEVQSGTGFSHGGGYCEVVVFNMDADVDNNSLGGIETDVSDRRRGRNSATL